MLQVDRMNKINRIVAYGCSYTAGDELMDHVVMGVTFEKCNDIKQQYLDTYSRNCAISYFRKDFKKISHYQNAYRNRTWAAQLAKRLNINFENRAVNGSGPDEHYFRIYNDLVNGLINDSDLILVGLTSMDRIIDFRPIRAMPHNNTLISASIPEEEGSRLFIELFNDDFTVYNYCKNIHLLHCLSSKINLLMQPMRKWWTIDHIIRRDIPNTKEYAINVWNECKPSLLSNLYLEDIVPACGFGHPAIESHTLLAEQLEELVRNRFQLLKIT
jgi:hypothetical protein